MLDLRILRDNFKIIADAISKRGKEQPMQAMEDAVDLDKQKRELLVQVEALKAKRNKVSKEIPALKKQGFNCDDLLREMKELSDTTKDLDLKIIQIDEELKKRMLSIPNTPHESVPKGADDANNQFVREFMQPTQFDFEPKSHWDLGADLGILDFETGAKVTGTRFSFYYGMGAKLERSVINFMLNTHTELFGFKEVLPPFIANEASMTGTGQLPKFAEDMYKLEGLDYYLIPTAEVPLTNIYRDSILEEEALPQKFVAYTPCFRAEAGSAGRDTKGLIRQHQFNKVELVKFATPENSYDELETLLASAEKILQLLKIPYRVVLLCGGDLGFASAKTYDIEVWMPSYNRFVEISSCSNYEDFQARRANIRYRDKNKKLNFVHTLNGSGLAVGRTVAAIMENYQQKDGSILIPEELQVYMLGRGVITK